MHSSSMSHSAQAANQIKQEAGFTIDIYRCVDRYDLYMSMDFTTLPLPSCFDAGRCVDIYRSMYVYGLMVFLDIYIYQNPEVVVTILSLKANTHCLNVYG